MFVCIFAYTRYKKYRAYAKLPLHKAVLHNQPISKEMVDQFGDTSRLCDMHGFTAIKLILDRIDSYDISDEVLYALILNSLHFDVTTGVVKEDPADHDYAWMDLVQHSEDVVCKVVDQIVSEYDVYIDLLADALDGSGRRCIDIASPRCRAIISSAMYLHKRFELQVGPPEHKSATSLVRFAVDHRLDEVTGVDCHARVALKFMKNRDQFLAEIETRSSADFSSEFVLMILASFDGDAIEDPQEQLFRASAVKKGYSDYPYCLVMDVADTNLQSYILKQNIAGNDWDEIKRITKSLCYCLRHVHDKFIMHGDIKPMNIVLANNSVHLIDFDACASFQPDEKQFSGRKFSSAYLPPEMFYWKKMGRAAVKRFVEDTSIEVVSVDEGTAAKVSKSASFKRSGKSFQFEFADPAQDMWAVGAVLYLLCTGTPLFVASVEDNTSVPEMARILEWSDELKDEKLSLVSDKYARNLLSLLLVKDPRLRLDASHVLTHPFISGLHPRRMQGEEPAYDVFLSYRVDSDSMHVEMLYNALTTMELKVWWDKVCLLPGQPWEVGFCDGLVNSRCFVCLLSKNAINHPDKPWQNFKCLENGSRCDNVLLEWRLALELRERQMIEGVFPVFFGTPSATDPLEYSDYFGSGCHPSPLPNISVGSVEGKVREHLGRQGLGLPLSSTDTVQGIMNEITANQGGFVRGDICKALEVVCTSIVAMRNQIIDQAATATVAATATMGMVEGVVKGGGSESARENQSTRMEIEALRVQLAQQGMLIQEQQALLAKKDALLFGHITSSSAAVVAAVSSAEEVSVQVKGE